ncbi:MAG: hypothetical protein ACREI7_00530 [Myxococcota bacterium]
MPQRIRDYGVAALALAAVFAALTYIDERVPAHVTESISDVAHGRWVEPGSAVGNLLASVAANPALDNFFVVALLAAGVVLVVLMVRT